MVTNTVPCLPLELADLPLRRLPSRPYTTYSDAIQTQEVLLRSLIAGAHLTIMPMPESALLAQWSLAYMMLHDDHLMCNILDTRTIK